MLAENSKRIAFAALVGGVTLGSAYLIYQWWKNKLKDIDDEGFSEKGVGEPLPKRILVLGLDGAGKSCLLAALSKQADFTGETQPTDGFNVVSVANGGIGRDLDIWEIGGSPKVRQYWTNFIQDTDILVFVVDSINRKRFPDAYTEMHKLLGDERLNDRPFLVLANKQDGENPADVAEIKEALGLEDVKHHRVQIVPTTLSPSKKEIVGVDTVQRLLIRL